MSSPSKHPATRRPRSEYMYSTSTDTTNAQQYNKGENTIHTA